MWSELHSFSSRGQRLVLEGLGASWWKSLIKRAGEPVGCLMKQGHLGFTRGGRVSITNHLCCTAKTIVGSSTAPRTVERFHSSVTSNTALATASSALSRPVCHHRGKSYCTAWWNRTCQDASHSSQTDFKCTCKKKQLCTDTVKRMI